MKALLLQIRNPEDPMRRQEVKVFQSALGLEDSLVVMDLLTEKLTDAALKGFGLVLIGGSGQYSACSTDPWIHGALDSLKLLCDSGTPVFASCWGFQALARALGGMVVNDPDTGELGTNDVYLTEAGKSDPLFSQLPDLFPAHMGHEDRVVELPEGAVLLASTDRVAHQAYTFPDRPIYATQFHPELTVETIAERLATYPEYLELITGMTFEQFRTRLQPTPDAATLLPRYLEILKTRVPNETMQP